jgi:hypothetical protein
MSEATAAAATIKVAEVKDMVAKLKTQITTCRAGLQQLQGDQQGLSLSVVTTLKKEMRNLQQFLNEELSTLKTKAFVDAAKDYSSKHKSSIVY